MNSTLKLLLFICFVSLQSCNTTKTTAEENSKEEILENMGTHELLLKDGYSLGSIKYIEHSNCSYIIVDKATNTKFDPINLDDKEFEIFKEDSLIIYFKFRRLRMPHRCDTIQPIELTEIKKEKS